MPTRTERAQIKKRARFLRREEKFWQQQLATGSRGQLRQSHLASLRRMRRWRAELMATGCDGGLR